MRWFCGIFHNVYERISCEKQRSVFFSKKNGFFSAGAGENAPAAPKNNGWRSTAITHYFSSGRDKKTFENADNHSP